MSGNAGGGFAYVGAMHDSIECKARFIHFSAPFSKIQ